MKKIIHIGYEHRNNDVRILQKECKTLALNNNYEVTFITSSKNSEAGEVKADNVRILVHPLTERKGARLLFYMRDVAAIIKQSNADVCHIHEWVLLPLVLSAKRLGIKVIYDKHEDTVGEIKLLAENRYGKIAGCIVAALSDAMECLAIRACDALIIVTPAFSYTTKHEKCYSKAVMVSNYPIEVTTEDDNSLEEYMKRDNKLVFAGGLGPSWKIKELVSLVNKMQDCRLEAAGAGEEAYIKEMETENTNGAAKYIGVLSHDKVFQFLRSGKIGIALLNSKIETTRTIGTLGNTKLFEYMRAGLPVICTKSVLWEKIVNDYKCGIAVDIDNSKEIEDAINYLMNNNEAAFKMGQNGEKAVKEYFNWNESKEKLALLYKKLLDE